MATRHPEGAEPRASRALPMMIIAAIVAATGLPSQAGAAPDSRNACEAKAQRENMRGGVRRTFMRECLAGRDLDRRKHKTFDSPAASSKGKDHRCIGASRLGKCER